MLFYITLSSTLRCMLLYNGITPSSTPRQMVIFVSLLDKDKYCGHLIVHSWTSDIVTESSTFQGNVWHKIIIKFFTPFLQIIAFAIIQCSISVLMVLWSSLWNLGEYQYDPIFHSVTMVLIYIILLDQHFFPTFPLQKWTIKSSWSIVTIVDPTPKSALYNQHLPHRESYHQFSCI